MKDSNIKMVIMHNDDKTPFEFVTEILSRFFDKTGEESVQLANQIHEYGAYPVAYLDKQEALNKIEIVMFNARKNYFPFQCEIVSIH